jgi:hypothetical protein
MLTNGDRDADIANWQFSANSRLVPATSFGSSAVHPADLKLRRLLEFLASKRIPRVWTDLEGR